MRTKPAYCKNIVVTGCFGFMGHHLTSKLLSMGFNVLGIDKLTYAGDPSHMLEFQDHDNGGKSFGTFEIWQEDIAEISRLPDCDVVINLAAESHVANSIDDSGDFAKTNIGGVFNLLELLRAKPGNSIDRPRLIHISTDEVYGDIEEGSFLEEDPLSPSNPYSATKAAGDMLITAWARTYGLDFNIVRPTNNYGTGQFQEKLIPLVVKLLEEGKKIRLHNEGGPVRTWLHVDDFCSAVIKIMMRGGEGEIYNVGGADEMPNIDAVKQIVEAYQLVSGEAINWDDHIDLNHVRQGQDVRYSVDDTKLRELGWKPTRYFNDNIRNIVQFYINEDWRW